MNAETVFHGNNHMCYETHVGTITATTQQITIKRIVILITLNTLRSVTCHFTVNTHVIAPKSQ